MPTIRLLALSMSFLLIPRLSVAALVTLFDGIGTPASQPWLAYANDGPISGGIAQESTSADGVRLLSNLAVSAGYSNYTVFSTLKNAGFPTLNPIQGFELNFSLAIAAESHASNDRAGFSIILLGNDKKGIELGFWNNEIWAQSQSPLFQHAEGVSIDTSVRRDYHVRIQGNAYTLLEGTNALLTGGVRDYTAFNKAPYTLTNFIFLGDDTSSAAGDITLRAISLQSDLSTVPEPTSLSLLASIALFGAMRRPIFLLRDA